MSVLDRLLTKLDIACGGPGSGRHKEFIDGLREHLKKKIKAIGGDEKVLDTLSIKHMDEKSKDAPSNAKAYYDRRINTMYVHHAAGNYFVTAQHEFGHHLSHVYFGWFDKTKVSPAKAALLKKADEEYLQEQRDASKDNEKEFESGSYAFKNKHEFFAEVVSRSLDSPASSAFMKESFPANHAIMMHALSGKKDIKAGGPGSGRKRSVEDEIGKIKKKKWKNQTDEERRKVAFHDKRQMKLFDKITSSLEAGGPGSGRKPGYSFLYKRTGSERWPEHRVTIKYKGKKVGGIHGYQEKDGNVRVEYAQVEEEHQGQGLAQDAYKHLFKNVGADVKSVSSGTSMMKTGHKLWKSMKKKDPSIAEGKDITGKARFVKQIHAGGPGSGRHVDPLTEERKLLKHEANLAKLRKQAKLARAKLAKSGVSARGTEIVSEKAKRALANVSSATKEHQDLAEEVEKHVAAATKGEKQPDNTPFDVITTDSKGRKHGIEVKALLYQKNDKITIKGKALQRKLDFAKKNKLYKIHTVGVDYRTDKDKPTVFHKEGVGAFRIGSMSTVKRNLSGLAAHMNLK